MEEQQKKPKVIVTSFNEKAILDVIGSLEVIETSYPHNQPVLVQVDSYGGSADGLAMIYDKLKSMDNPIMTYTSSKAMSAGAILLSTAASPNMRLASPEATIMIHEIQSGAGGDIKDMEDQMILNKVINDRWMKILAKSMGLKSAADIRTLIKKKAIGHDVYLTAQQAMQLKLIDGIGSIRMAPFFGWGFTVIKPNR
jgi:ATP-dependent protease ClpP protease subunit